jgi:hypothetical protein
MLQKREQAPKCGTNEEGKTVNQYVWICQQFMGHESSLPYSQKPSTLPFLIQMNKVPTLILFLYDPF